LAFTRWVQLLLLRNQFRYQFANAHVRNLIIYTSKQLTVSLDLLVNVDALRTHPATAPG
jgi:hypothetical protein